MLDQQRELAGIAAMLEHGRVGAEHDRHACGAGHAHRLAEMRQRLARLGGDNRREPILGEAFAHAGEGHQGRHQDAVRPLHRLDRRRVGEGAVLDRIDAGAGRRLDAARAMGVGGDLEAERMGGGDDRPHLLVGEMRLEAAPLLRQHAAGGGELDDVGAGA